MKKEVFLAMVLASVLEVKANSTAEEKAKLNYTTFNFSNMDNCILGQMTGNSETARANQITKKTLMFDRDILIKMKEDGVKFRENEYKYGNHPDPQYLEEVLVGVIEVETELAWYSPFEIFMLMKGANIKELFDFVKGDRETFEPTFGA